MARSSKYGSLIDCEAPEVARIARLRFPGLWSCFSHIWPLKLKELSCESCDRRKRFFNFCTVLWFCFFCNSIRYYVRGPVMVRQCCSCRRPGFFWQSVLALIWPGLVFGLAWPGLALLLLSLVGKVGKRAWLCVMWTFPIRKMNLWASFWLAKWKQNRSRCGYGSCGLKGLRFMGLGCQKIEDIFKLRTDIIAYA